MTADIWHLNFFFIDSLIITQSTKVLKWDNDTSRLTIVGLKGIEGSFPLNFSCMSGGECNLLDFSTGSVSFTKIQPL
jgi:hypothetical protein